MMIDHRNRKSCKRHTHTEKGNTTIMYIITEKQ
jgi:hypothetical protein